MPHTQKSKHLPATRYATIGISSIHMTAGGGEDTCRGWFDPRIMLPALDSGGSPHSPWFAPVASRYDVHKDSFLEGT